MKHASGKSNIDILKDYVAGVRPFSQIGYTGKQYAKRKVGERWTDAKGIEWIQKEFGPVTVSRVGDIVRAARDQKCKCGQDIKWGSRLDHLFFTKTGLCESCLIDYETKLRILGIYDDYEKFKVLSNQLGVFEDAKAQIESAIKFFEEGSGDVEMLCNSEGFVERWKNTNRDQILKDAKKDLRIARKRIAEVKREKNSYKKKYVKAASGYNLDTYGR